MRRRRTRTARRTRLGCRVVYFVTKHSVFIGFCACGGFAAFGKRGAIHNDPVPRPALAPKHRATIRARTNLLRVCSVEFKHPLIALAASHISLASGRQRARPHPRWRRHYEPGQHLRNVWRTVRPGLGRHPVGEIVLGLGGPGDRGLAECSVIRDQGKSSPREITASLRKSKRANYEKICPSR